MEDIAAERQWCSHRGISLQVVRCFEDENVIHVAGKVDPVEDIDVINFELALADITQIEKRLERIAKGRAKTKEEIASNEVQPAPLMQLWSQSDHALPAQGAYAQNIHGIQQGCGRCHRAAVCCEDL